MKLENEAELGNTRKLLEELQEQIARKAEIRAFKPPKMPRASNRSCIPPTNCAKRLLDISQSNGDRRLEDSRPFRNSAFFDRSFKP